MLFENCAQAGFKKSYGNATGPVPDLLSCCLWKLFECNYCYV